METPQEQANRRLIEASKMDRDLITIARAWPFVPLHRKVYIMALLAWDVYICQPIERLLGLRKG